MAVYLRVQTCGREAANPLHPFASPESERLAVSLKGAVLGSAELYVAIGYLVCGVWGFFENLRATDWELWLWYSAHRLKLSLLNLFFLIRINRRAVGAGFGGKLCMSGAIQVNQQGCGETVNSL